MANIHLIGGEKGGVGKSVVARLLAQYCIDRSIPFLGFDADRSHGALMRFYADYASAVLVDRYESLDAIVESATDNPERRIIVDLAAQAEEPLTQWMDESQLLEVAREIGLNIRYWHVMDSGRDSVDLLRRLFDRYGQRLSYVIVLNQLRGDDFHLFRSSGLPERAHAFNAATVTLKHLSDATMLKIDENSSSFWSAAEGESSGGLRFGMLERQRFKTWLKSAYEAIEPLGV
ncbi:MAG TPA: hypothetical protein VMF64_17515 [Steroidobacteraceae bacterium]|nr:hypothetical protein [Steroidobacteraceae bacterium]